MKEAKLLRGSTVLFIVLLGGLAWSAGLSMAATVDPMTVPKFVDPLTIPPAMPKTVKSGASYKGVDYYEIAVRQFNQQILPMGLPKTKIWGYGSINHPKTFNYPSYTIEAKAEKPVRVKWINDLKDPKTGKFLPHLLPVDQTIHWANPPGGIDGRDMRPMEPDPTPYTGPVPMVAHLHGSHVQPNSDGYPEAWWLPAATNIPAGYATIGSHYDQFDNTNTQPGTAVFQYPNTQQAATLWFHDHSLGMTRVNVYAGPAGFYLLRGGDGDKVKDKLTKGPAILPGPAPALGDRAGTKYYEIPIVIQDKSFNADGSLFYPDNRAFFEGLTIDQLLIPFAPQLGCDGNMSDVAPIWNPEFFGDSIVVNGKTWPFLKVEQRRYRFRLLNASDSRFFILKLSNDMPFYQIGADGGFLPSPVTLNTLLIGPAERADVIVDFTNVPMNTNIVLQNIGPDEPFGGGVPGTDFPMANPDTTGQIMQFRVVAGGGADNSTPVARLQLPDPPALGFPTNTRQVSLNEAESDNVFIDVLDDGSIVLNCASETRMGPTQARLGILDDQGNGLGLLWMDDITENPALNATEIWEIHNFTEDAHPIHIHLVQFQIVERQPFGGDPYLPEAWESGRKDTVISYPGEITRVKAKFDIPGLFVWHCHILSHEDNEMMRPYRVGP